MFREQQRAQAECEVGKATENIQQIRQAIGFKANVNLRESLSVYRFTRLRGTGLLNVCERLKVEVCTPERISH